MNNRIIINLINGSRDFKIEFVLVIPGKYRIANRPLLAMRNSTVEYSKGFWMQEITVSTGLYEFVYGEVYSENGRSEEENAVFPWYGVCFGEIADFLNRLNQIIIANNYHFKVDAPSITEWEHALLCGKDKDWSWGDDEDELVHYAWFRKNSGNKVHVSRQKKPNDWGLYDMYGNIHEYCYQSLLESEESYFLDPKIVMPNSKSMMPCMGGAYDSDEEHCCGYYIMDYNNEFIEPAGVRLIIRE